MSLAEAFRILAEHQKWRTSQPPYHYDPDGDEWWPKQPTATPAQLTEAINQILSLFPNP